MHPTTLRYNLGERYLRGKFITSALVLQQVTSPSSRHGLLPADPSRAKTEHINRLKGLLPESQGQNSPALTVSSVPCWL